MPVGVGRRMAAVCFVACWCTCLPNPFMKLNCDSLEEKLNISLLFTDFVEEYGALDPLLRYY